MLVDLVEMLGSEKLVHSTIAAPSVYATDTSIETGTETDSTVIASLDPAPRHPRCSERVTLTVDLLRLHAFDLESGDAIGRA